MSIKRNFLYNVVLNVTNILFPIVTIPYVSRILGVEQIGIFTFVTTIVSYFTLFAALGTPLYGTREIAKVASDSVKTNILFNEIFSINLISSIVFSVLYLFCVSEIETLNENKIYLLVSGISLYLSALNIDWFYSGTENFKLIAKRSIITKILMMLALFLLVKNRDDLLIYVFLNALAILGNQLWNIMALIISGFRLHFTLYSLRRHIKPLIILLFSTIAMQIYLMIDTLMLGIMSDYTELGLYSSAVKSVRMIMPMTIALGVVLLPRLSYLRGLKAKDEICILLNNAFDVITFFSIPLAVFFFCISETFVPLFFGIEYMDAILPMKICSFLIFVSNISYFFAIQILTTHSYEKEFLICTVLGMLFNIVGNFALIPLFGAVGASISSLVGESVVAICSVLYVAKYHLFKVKWKSVFITFVYTMPFFVLLIFLDFRKFSLYPIEKLIIYSLLSWGAYFLIRFYLSKRNYCILFIRTKLNKK